MDIHALLNLTGTDLLHIVAICVGAANLSLHASKTDLAKRLLARVGKAALKAAEAEAEAAVKETIIAAPVAAQAPAADAPRAHVMGEHVG
jgi:hypothetical protein